MKIVLALLPATVFLVFVAGSQLVAQKREVASLRQEVHRRELRVLSLESDLSRTEERLKRTMRDLQTEKAASRLCLQECFATE